MERIPYKDAGQRLRLSRQRLAESEFVLVEGNGKSERRTKLATNSRAWRLWAVCIERTASYSQAADRTYVESLASLTGMRPDKVTPLLRAFDSEGVFVWRKDRGRISKGFLALPSLGGSESEPKQAKAATDWQKRRRGQRTYKDVLPGSQNGSGPMKCASCGSTKLAYYTEADEKAGIRHCRECGQANSTARSNDRERDKA